MSSCSSMPRSMPMYDVQANSTARRSLAPGASVYGGGPPRPCACAPAVNSPLTARTMPSATVCCLVIGVPRGDRDDGPVGLGNGLEKPNRTAVPRRDELRGDEVPCLEDIRGLAAPPLREGGGGAGREHPLGGRAIRVLDLEMKRPVGVHKLDDCERPRDLLFPLHVVDTREGMMSLQRAAGHQPHTQDAASQSSPHHSCLREVVIGTRCHQVSHRKKAGPLPLERSIA